MRIPEHETPDVFAVTEAGGAGLTRKQTRGRSFVSPSAGVRLRADAVTVPGATVRAALLGCRQDVVLTGPSAARAWGLPLPQRLATASDQVFVAVTAGSARPRRADAQGRRLRLPSEHVTTVGGLPVTTAARTWLDCAAVLSLGHVVAMGDVVLRRDLASPEDLRRLCHWAYRRRGVAVARRALPLLDRASGSPGESWVRTILVTSGIRAPRCNADVIHRGGWLACVDLLWDRERVVVEYDGIVHLPEEQRRKDAARRNLLQDAGWKVIVFTARDLKHPEAMCALVRSALARSREHD